MNELPLHCIVSTHTLDKKCTFSKVHRTSTPKRKYTRPTHNAVWIPAPPWVEMGHAVCSEERQAGFTVMPTIQAQGVFSIMLPLKVPLGLGSWLLL